ncbi:hypothetical protein HPB47_007690 [Ixodes persulcatus]|uniref:Uncharacterized protein n=1 Tax=Ixodes persulcatus TaxID=34615 RepID=A0AC60P761_IXOPE|nr:hypothetical protein HPB47_007690 [Ixodes persulcatus]
MGKWCMQETETAQVEGAKMSESQAYTNALGAPEAHSALEFFWPRIMEETRNLGMNEFKNQELPLARIKKIMKLDEDVKMISAEAPVLFARAAEIFITELSLRAWVHTEDNKRRTLQRNDIAMAITKYDQFDFLIDIVPRDELKPAAKRTDDTVRTTVMPPDQVQYYFQLAQQHREALQQQQQPTTLTAAQAQQPQQIQIVQTTGANPQTLTVQNVQNAAQAFSMPSVLQVQQVGAASAEQQQQNAQQQQIQLQVQAQPQVVQLQQPVQQQVAQQGGIQIVQQIINSNGEIQQIPIQLTQAQLQLIRMQMQGQSSGQPIIIQTAPIQQAAPPPQPVQQTQTLYQIQQGPGQPASVFLAPAGSMTAAGQTAVQIQTQQDGQQSEDDGTDQ